MWDYSQFVFNRVEHYLGTAPARSGGGRLGPGATTQVEAVQPGWQSAT